MSDKLSFAGRLFTDADLEDLPVRDRLYPYSEVDFSQNSLSAHGLRTVLELCLRCENLRVLKLYKNDIDDEGAEALARFVRECRYVEEMHLSHNRFTKRGVTAIVTAAEKTRPEGANPLWLRLEQNDVAEPERVLQELQSYLSVCARRDQRRCTVRECVNGCKVHLPHFCFQRGGPQDSWGGRGDRRQRWGQAGGWEEYSEAHVSLVPRAPRQGREDGSWGGGSTKDEGWWAGRNGHAGGHGFGAGGGAWASDSRGASGWAEHDGRGGGRADPDPYDEGWRHVGWGGHQDREPSWDSGGHTRHREVRVRSRTPPRRPPPDDGDGVARVRRASGGIFVRAVAAAVKAGHEERRSMHY